MTERAPTSVPEPRSMSWLVFRVTTAALRAVMVLAVACLIADLVIWGLTWTSPRVTMPEWINFPFFGFGIASVIVTVLMIAKAHGRNFGPGDLGFRHLPKWLLGSLVLIAAGFVATGPIELFRIGPGQPGYNAATHQYYFSDHGRVIPTTRGPYLSGVATGTRAFLAFAIFATCVALVLSAAELARRKRLDAPRLAELPEPAAPRPRWCPPGLVGVAVTVGALVVAAIPGAVIVTRITSYMSSLSTVTTSGVVKHFDRGPFVVFTRCQTQAIEAPYDCPSMAPRDIVIRDVITGAVIKTSPDPSSDHISPGELPAVGQLKFEVASAGSYRLELTRVVPKAVFVGASPGSVARSLAAVIAGAAVAIAVAVLGVVLIVRRILWRVLDAPWVDVEPV